MKRGWRSMENKYVWNHQPVFFRKVQKKKKTSVGLGISSFVPQLKKCQRINRFEARDLRVVEDTIEIYTYLGKL